MGKSSSKKDPSTKADQKFEKKLEFYSKVRDTVASLTAKKAITKQKKKLRSRQKKLKAYDLSALSEFLPDIKSPQKQTALPRFKLKCKSMNRLILSEAKQLNTVLNHPAFAMDPLGSICKHLEITQPIVEEKPKQRPNRNGSKKRKGKSKTLSGPQSMDI